MEGDIGSDAGDAGDAGGAGNTCSYGGQVYTEGAVVCMDGTEYRCANLHGRSFTWEPTGRSCGDQADASMGGGDDAGGAGSLDA